MLLIAIFVAALMYSWYYSGYSYWNDSFSCPAACVDDLEKGGEPMQWAIAYFVLVLRAYPLALLSMSTTVRASWLVRYRHRFIDHRACNESCGESKEGNHRDEGNRSSVLERVVRALRRMGRIGKVYVFLPLWYLFSSETEAVLEQVAWYIIAVYWVTVDRDHGHSIMDEEQIHEENNWAFGQIVPLLLLLIPLLEFIERTEGEPQRPLFVASCTDTLQAILQLSWKRRDIRRPNRGSLVSRRLVWWAITSAKMRGVPRNIRSSSPHGVHLRPCRPASR